MSQQCSYYAKITMHDFEIYFGQSTFFKIYLQKSGKTGSVPLLSLD